MLVKIKIFRKSVILLVSCAVAIIASAVANADEKKRISDAIKGMDFQQRFEFLLPLAEAGDSEAQYLVGNLLYRGQGVEKNLSESTRWIIESANQGHPDALYHLGTQYLHGIGVQTDTNIMIELWQKAAKMGNAWAQEELGTIYAKGELVEQDLNKAVNFWEAAVEQNHPVAKYQLGVMLRDGTTVPQNYERAIKLFSEAAEHMPIAAYNTGSMIYHGTGAPKSAYLAYSWFKLATLANDKSEKVYQSPQAEIALDKFKELMSDAQLDAAEKIYQSCLSRRFENCLSYEP
jgi:TPR repeat protein